MLIYRVETEEGVGAFASGLSRVHDLKAKRCRRTAYDMPSPWVEPEKSPVHVFANSMGLDKHHLFGFRSLTQLRRTFRSKLGCKAMAKKGGVVSVIEIPRDKVIIGTDQVIFDSRYVQSKRTHSLTEVHP